MAVLSDILRDNRYQPDDIPVLEGKLFFEGDRRRRYLVRFTVLLFLATVIAANGVIEDSTATVIGAMIIAPLMTPILATTAALVMGNGTRAWQSFLLVVAGVLGVIAVSAALGAMAVHVVDFHSNSQITGRVSPRIVDLFVALAAGTAAAFATSRDDVADSLPGVAISISLVPPLCVAGISLAAAQWTDAFGALLLFVTNFLSILLAGGGIFALLGLGVAATESHSHLNKRRAYRVIALGVLLVAIPLSLTSARVYRDSIAQLNITSITSKWASEHPSSFVVRSVLVSGGKAKILITGPEEPPTIDDLGAQIASEVEQVAVVDLSYVPSQDYKHPKLPL
jgi:uncharacterized hydrophobic protein (TIGR00271 family)